MLQHGGLEPNPTQGCSGPWQDVSIEMTSRAEGRQDWLACSAATWALIFALSASILVARIVGVALAIVVYVAVLRTRLAFAPTDSG